MSLETLALEVGRELKNRHLKLATAESCTGGGLSYWVTSIAGSSDWFDRGFVTYSNQAKLDMLAVNAQTLATHGAVSEQTAREMAAGALKLSKADMSIAITGIAGPNGGSIEKPVGTIWLAWAKRNGTIHTETHIFAGNRDEVRTRTIERALQILILYIKS